VKAFDYPDFSNLEKNVYSTISPGIFFRLTNHQKQIGSSGNIRVGSAVSQVLAWRYAWLTCCSPIPLSSFTITSITCTLSPLASHRVSLPLTFHHHHVTLSVTIPTSTCTTAIISCHSLQLASVVYKVFYGIYAHRMTLTS
jgi:hypothetical protein